MQLMYETSVSQMQTRVWQTCVFRCECKRASECCKCAHILTLVVSQLETARAAATRSAAFAEETGRSVRQLQRDVTHLQSAAAAADGDAEGSSGDVAALRDDNERQSSRIATLEAQLEVDASGMLAA